MPGQPLVVQCQPGGDGGAYRGTVCAQVKGPTGVRALDLSGEVRSPGDAASAGPRPQRPEH